MRSKIGTICMLFGAVLVLAALSLFLWNQRESDAAGISSGKILPQVIEQIEIKKAAASPEDGPSYSDPYDTSIYDTAMTEVEIDGYAYVGYLSVPSLELELPVMSEWDESRLKIAPCRYAGSTKTGDLVICAHNYVRHFGPVRSLEYGDLVYFTDMDGVVWKYEVAAKETLRPAEVEEMTAGDYDLTLFTCSYGGQNRVAVRCECTDEGV